MTRYLALWSDLQLALMHSQCDFGGGDTCCKGRRIKVFYNIPSLCVKLLPQAICSFCKGPASLFALVEAADEVAPGSDVWLKTPALHLPEDVQCLEHLSSL